MFNFIDFTTALPIRAPLRGSSPSPQLVTDGRKAPPYLNLPIIKKSSDRTILTMIEVTIGKKNVVFPLLIIKSPGNLPTKDHKTPIAKKAIPKTINSFEMPIFISEPPYQSVRIHDASPFVHAACAVETQFEEGKAHTHLQSYDFLLQWWRQSYQRQQVHHETFQ